MSKTDRDLPLPTTSAPHEPIDHTSRLTLASMVLLHLCLQHVALNTHLALLPGVMGLVLFLYGAVAFFDRSRAPHDVGAFWLVLPSVPLASALAIHFTAAAYRDYVSVCFVVAAAVVVAECLRRLVAAERKSVVYL